MLTQINFTLLFFIFYINQCHKNRTELILLYYFSFSILSINYITFYCTKRLLLLVYVSHTLKVHTHKINKITLKPIFNVLLELRRNNPIIRFEFLISSLQIGSNNKKKKILISIILRVI